MRSSLFAHRAFPEPPLQNLTCPRGSSAAPPNTSAAPQGARNQGPTRSGRGHSEHRRACADRLQGGGAFACQFGLPLKLERCEMWSAVHASALHVRCCSCAARMSHAKARLHDMGTPRRSTVAKNARWARERVTRSSAADMMECPTPKHRPPNTKACACVAERIEVLATDPLRLQPLAQTDLDPGEKTPLDRAIRLAGRKHILRSRQLWRTPPFPSPLRQCHTS